MFIANDPVQRRRHAPAGHQRSSRRCSSAGASSRSSPTSRTTPTWAAWCRAREAAVCKSIYQEGIRIPPVRIMREGELNRDVLDLILLNSRTPERARRRPASAVRGQHGRRAQRAALFERYGVARDRGDDRRLSRFHREALPRGDRAACRAASTRPRTFSTATAEGDGARSGSRLSSRSARAGSISISPARTAQLESARNIPYRALLATVYTRREEPARSRSARERRLLPHDARSSAPPGSVVGPVPPAAIGCRSISCGVLGDVIAAALSQAMPEKALAGSGPHHLFVLSGTDPRTGELLRQLRDASPAAWARAPYRDGVDGVRVHASGASNLPVEALEHAYPVSRRALRAVGRLRRARASIAAAWAWCATTACSPTTSS